MVPNVYISLSGTARTENSGDWGREEVGVDAERSLGLIFSQLRLFASALARLELGTGILDRYRVNLFKRQACLRLLLKKIYLF